jgi:hypothetical protein
MKKQIVLFFLGVFAFTTIGAQDHYEKRVAKNVTSYIERIENNIKLSKEEKDKIYELKKTHTISFWEVAKKFKEQPELKDEKTKVSKALSQSIVKEFGRKRGVEILKASRVKKEE